MSTVIGRDDVRRMIATERAQAVEVLSRDEYASAHIAGAVSLPLKELDRESARHLDRVQPLIVYCNDFL